MNTLMTSLIIAIAIIVAGCADDTPTAVQPEPAKAASNVATTAAVAAVETEVAPATTQVTDENYALAESQIIFTNYAGKAAAATGTNGAGTLIHLKKGADPADRTVMRINFDTLYSFAIVDLSEDAKLTMPATDGRYQSAWIITEEHYNPMAFVTPGVHTLTQENVGSRYAMIAIRTQANTADAADMAIANALQEQLLLEQKDRGSYTASDTWDMDEVLAMRAKYMAITDAEHITSDMMFGKKGEVSLQNHNAGSAYGWGGFTPERAVYPGYTPTSAAPQTLTLKDVPAKAFWSITIYDVEGYPQGAIYNINSQFALADDDGSYTIHFGGDKTAPNYMDVFEGWNFTLRIYEPTAAYFSGEWVKPELALVE